jgi:predicted DNA repair protein MutK
MSNIIPSTAFGDISSTTTAFIAAFIQPVILIGGVILAFFVMNAVLDALDRREIK